MDAGKRFLSWFLFFMSETHHRPDGRYSVGRFAGFVARFAAEISGCIPDFYSFFLTGSTKLPALSMQCPEAYSRISILLSPNSLSFLAYSRVYTGHSCVELPSHQVFILLLRQTYEDSSTEPYSF